MTGPRRASPRHPAVMKHADHGRLWRMVEGAVVDTFHKHPNYLTAAGYHSAVPSITKRVVGQIVGHAAEARKRSRPQTGGFGDGAEISGAHQGAGRHLLPLSRTRFPALYAVLCGGGSYRAPALRLSWRGGVAVSVAALAF